jgi:hypothetical protein
MDNQVSAPEPRAKSGWKIALSCGGCFLLVAVVLTALLVRFVDGSMENRRRLGCMGRMKQIGVAMRLYSEDYNGRLPSAGPGVSDLQFETTLGKPGVGRSTTWAEELYRYCSAYLYVCPSDHAGSGMSYHYKHAINLACKAGKASTAVVDSAYRAEQIVLYERKPFHDGGCLFPDRSKQNVLYLDLHVKGIRMSDVAPDREPRYFNYLDTRSPYAAKAKKPYWDPRCCYDVLP